MSKRTYYIPRQIAPAFDECMSVDIPARYVPSVLRAIEHIKGTGFWSADTDAEQGYKGLCMFQWGLLVCSAEGVINNLIALRGISPTAPRDPATGVPLSPPEGSTLLDLFATLQTPVGTPGAALGAIQTATEATAQNVATGLGVGGDEGNVVFLAQLLGVI